MRTCASMYGVVLDNLLSFLPYIFPTLEGMLMALLAALYKNDKFSGEQHIAFETLCSQTIEMCAAQYICMAIHIIFNNRVPNTPHSCMNQPANFCFDVIGLPSLYALLVSFSLV